MKINKFTSAVAGLMLAGAVTSVFACGIPVDIHPTSCPNPLNVGSNGLVPAAMLGTENRDVRQINLIRGVVLFGYVGTKRIEVEAVKAEYEDVATPYSEGRDCSDEYSCNENGPDGYEDLVLKFPMQGSDGKPGVADLLEGMENGETRCLEIQAFTFGGQRWHGEDVVIVKGVKKAK
jgi:hypothetical protein